MRGFCLNCIVYCLCLDDNVHGGCYDTEELVRWFILLALLAVNLNEVMDSSEK